MKTIFFSLLLIFIAASSQLQAQTRLETNFYTNNYRRPGASIVYSQGIGNWAKATGNRTVQKGLLFGLRIGFYQHSGKHTAYFLQPFLRFARTGKQGWFWQPELGLGYLFKKNDLPTYQIKNGEMEEINLAGHHRWYPTIALGLGYDFFKTTAFPFRVHIRPGLAFEYPNNTSGLFHFQSEFGIGYHF